MAKKIILGILPDSNSLETALNNLSEADFDEKDISVVMENETIARKLSNDTGPLKGQNASTIKTRLKKLGISDSISRMYQTYLQQGKVLIGIQTDQDAVNAAEEMLKDYNTQQIVVV